MASPAPPVGDAVAARPRLAAVDALRGVAALWVVLYHVPAHILEAARMPAPLRALFHAGDYGVDAFFVLSGFVIALSLRDGPYTPRFLGRFLLRRSVRLDPPYWVAMALEVTLGWVGVRFLGDAHYTFPDAAGVAAHLFYAQGLLGVKQISDVFWTLCFEIQFYLVFAGLLVLAHHPGVRRRLPPRLLMGGTLALLAGWSVAIRNGWTADPLPGLALIRAFQFALGVGAYHAATSARDRGRWAWALLALVAARQLAAPVLETAVVTVAVAVCYGSVRRPSLNRWLGARALQWLGARSYSLYLYHASITGRAAAVALLAAPLLPGPLAPVLGIVGGIAGSLLLSALLHRLVEAPCLRWSRTIRLWRSRPRPEPQRTHRYALTLSPSNSGLPDPSGGVEVSATVNPC